MRRVLTARIPVQAGAPTAERLDGVAPR
jgi:hypothetical protein